MYLIYRSVITKFDVGKATAWHAVKRVVKALCNLTKHFIIWPSEHEMIDSAKRIRRMYGYRNVVGAVDGTQIRIPAPKIDSQSYINREGFHAIQLQVSLRCSFFFVCSYSIM